MTVKIPPQSKKWSQLNQGNLLGVLASSKGIDLDSSGILKLAQRTRYVGRTSSGDFSTALAIVYGNFQSSATTFEYWVVSGGAVFVLSADLSTFGADVLANTPATHFGSDGCTWNGNLYVTKTARVSKLAAGTWTTSWSSADFANTASGYPHPIEPNVTNENVLIGDGNLLKRCISDGTIDTALTLPSNYKINWIRRGVNVNYIGLDSTSGRGAVAVWDGLDTTLEANAVIPIKARTPLSGVIDEDGVFNIIQSDGRLMRFNGSGFSYEAELPPFRDYFARRDWGGSLSVAGRVLNRGMEVIKGRIHVNVENVLNSTPIYVPNFPGGVWVFDKDSKAFYPKYSASNSQTITDYGTFGSESMAGAIYPFLEGRNTDPTTTVGGVLIAGGRAYGDTTATAYRTLYSVTTGENRGQFSTCRIESQQITDDGIALWCKFQGVQTSSDKIIFKYRTKYRNPILLIDTIAWSSTTVFTTTDTGMASAEVGDEITVVFGNGAGSMAHITTIVLNGGTYTVTVDEAITGISSTNSGYILVDNWKKLTPTITYLDTDGYKKISIPVKNRPWFEIKGELRGEGGLVAIQELQIINKNNLPAE